MHIDKLCSNQYNGIISLFGRYIMTTKLFERLVTKFSIKVSDLVKYLEISKATIYNYRNLENFSDIPKDKQLKILYLFGKETEADLELVLDESDVDILAQYINRISSILKGSVQEKKESIASIESLTAQNEELTQENATMKRQLSSLRRLEVLDDFTKTIVIDKVSNILEGASTAEVRQFIDYLEIFEKYRRG